MFFHFSAINFHFLLANHRGCLYTLPVLRDNGVLAQLVERLNGIEEVSGSNPLCSSLRFFGEKLRLGKPLGLPSQLFYRVRSSL